MTAPVRLGHDGGIAVSILDSARARERRWDSFVRPTSGSRGSPAADVLAHRRDTRDFAGSARRYGAPIDVRTAIGSARSPAAVRSTRALRLCFPGGAEALGAWHAVCEDPSA